MFIVRLVQSWIVQFAAPVDSLGIGQLMLLASALGIYLVGLAVYRLFFSPLSRIPGTALSKLTVAKLNFDMLTGRAGRVAHADYYKHGDIYTLAPNFVVLNNPTDCRSVLSSHRFVKSPIYNIFALVDDCLFTTSLPELANARRKQIGPAFTHAHLAEMEPVILECGAKAIKRKWDTLIDQAGGTVE
ncbi:hypothetical protein LPJ73_007266, partial [Coemansia sp. RSA 2703]